MSEYNSNVHSFAMIWAINGNTVPAVFWTLYHLLAEDGERLAAVREESAYIAEAAAQRDNVSIRMWNSQSFGHYLL